MLTVMTRSRERERERGRVLIVHAEEEEEEDLEKLEVPAILSLKIACEFKLQLPWLRLSYTCICDQWPTLDPKLFTTVHDSTPLDLVSIICTWPRALTVYRSRDEQRKFVPNWSGCFRNSTVLCAERCPAKARQSCERRGGACAICISSDGVTSRLKSYCTLLSWQRPRLEIALPQRPIPTFAVSYFRMIIASTTLVMTSSLDILKEAWL